MELQHTVLKTAAITMLRRHVPLAIDNPEGYVRVRGTATYNQQHRVIILGRRIAHLSIVWHNLLVETVLKKEIELIAMCCLWGWIVFVVMDLIVL